MARGWEEQSGSECHRCGGDHPGAGVPCGFTGAGCAAGGGVAGEPAERRLGGCPEQEAGMGSGREGGQKDSAGLGSLRRERWSPGLCGCIADGSTILGDVF